MDEAAIAAELGSAVELYSRGDAAGAHGRCQEILARAPGHRDAQVLLGLVLHSQRRYTEAAATFAALAAQDPREPSHWSNLGTALRGDKRFDEALRAYARAAELGDASASFFFNVGLTHLDRRDFEAARAIFARAAALAPQDIEIRLRHAQACFETLRTEEASRIIEGWEKLPDLTSEHAANIGFLLMNLGEAARAEAALGRAALDPAPPPEVQLTLVQVLERTNRVPEARALLDRLTADPRADSLGDELLLAQAQLAERESRHEASSRLFERVLHGIHEFELRHFQLFRLARSLDAQRRYEEAFDALLEAHRSQAAYLARTAPGITLRGIPVMSMTQFGCDPADVATWSDPSAPPVAQSPIFIVGFPRSGTTLLELTLDAHPLLKSMDEQVFLQNALTEMISLGVQYPGALGGLSPEQLAQLRASYWERVRRKVRLEPGQRLVDKNPLNILRLPVIRRLFPHARVLLAVRHPCDVLLSCFMQHFRAPDFALMCSDLGQLALGYRRALDFWYEQRRILEPTQREIRYETFVANFEAEIRDISTFLELPWDERMLEPAAHARAKRFISTPSYSQVVQPVNQKSVARWRPYERHFADILPLLRPYLERWSYDA